MSVRPAPASAPRTADPHGPGSAPGRLRLAKLHLAVARRAARRYGVQPVALMRSLDERMVFVVGSPRSGTSFTAEALGGVPGFADLGEVNPLKAMTPTLVRMQPADAAPRVRRILRSVQRMGMVGGARAIEQTPESTYLVPALALAFPEARFLHLLRDGRDVACSLIERGWLADGGPGDVAAVTGNTADDARQPFGAWARFWVEPERREEFARVSEARRAAWAWRRYVTTAQGHLADLPAHRSLTVRYERLVGEPADVAVEVATFLDVPDRVDAVRAELEQAFDRSKGRWRRDLDAAQQADVQAEAGALLAELGYHD